MQGTAIFAAGCFWGVEVTFRNTPGVTDVRVGYTGGHTEAPTYKEVCSDRTGHAEAVEVTYDDEKVSFDQLLDVFFANHNPTTRNRQGPDVGTQYRSAVFATTKEQEREAIAKIRELDESGAFAKPIVTEVVPAGTFYPAEEYHQRYLEKRGLASCHI